MQKFRIIPLLFWLFLPLLVAAPIHGADSTSFDPTKVEVKAKGSGGVPVGTIISWPVATNPEDMDNWLECNGQSISRSVYPELFAVVGAQTPDLRGLFLRGVGGNAAQLGVVQQDAMREHNHSMARGNWTGDYRPYSQGSGTYQGTINTNGVVGSPTAEENRPVNMAVRYLIRAQ